MNSKHILLAGNLAVVLAMNVYAEDIQTETNDSPPIPWGEVSVALTTLTNGNGTILNNWFNAGCALFGVHDKGLNDSRFFCINSKGGNWFWNVGRLDIEGLDYNGSDLFFSSGDDVGRIGRNNGAIYKVCSLSLANCRFGCFIWHGDGVAEANGQPMEEVDGIAFDPDGNMWGWAQESGLFMVPPPVQHNRKLAKLVLPQPGEVEDVEWLDGKLYGVLNIDHMGQVEDGDGEQHPNHPTHPEDVNAAVTKTGTVIKANFIEYDPISGKLTVPCEQQVIAALQENKYQFAEIEALEFLPKLPPPNDDDYLLLGFHTNKPGLVTGVLNLSQCTLELQHVTDIPELRRADVEGLTMVCPPIP